MAIQSFRCHDNFFHLCLDKGDIILFFIKRSDWTMEKIFYGSLGIALCITGIWGIIREFIPEKCRLFKKGRKEK